MNRKNGRAPEFNSNWGNIHLIQFKSGFTQRRDDATKGNKGISLMLGAFAIKMTFILRETFEVSKTSEV